MAEVMKFYNEDGEEVEPENATRFEAKDEESGRVTVGYLSE